MSISTDSLSSPLAGDPTWHRFAGAGVTVYVPPGNSLDERATQELREAEQLLDGLRKTLELAEDHPVHIDIYLIGSPVGSGSKGSDSAGSRTRHQRRGRAGERT